METNLRWKVGWIGWVVNKIVVAEKYEKASLNQVWNPLKDSWVNRRRVERSILKFDFVSLPQLPF